MFILKTKVKKKKKIQKNIRGKIIVGNLIKKLNFKIGLK